MNSNEPQESVAIVGMAGRFPQAKNVEEFWRNLREGRECVSFFADDQVQWLPIEHPPRLDDPRYVKARAVMEKPEWFDAAFFGMNPKEAEVMDPQHRVFLECAWEALEHAGCNPDTYDGMIGVFAGASMNTYLFTNLLTNPNLVKDFGLFSSMIMNDGDFVPTRASYKFNLRGPSVNVQTACSTSLVAVCMAAQNLLSYRCDVALAGGVSITFPPNRGQHHQEGGILSPDGHCRTFDTKAAGTVLGDGCGVVALKRLSDAIADGDNVLAVIKGTAINNDGAVKIGYTAPSSDGQAEAIALAQAEAGVAPETISYIEAHGTGTPLGDPIEIEGLTKAFGVKDRKQFCAVGSVKSNIGHLDIAAGVAGLIKTVLALQKEEIPPSLHFEAPNPKIDFANSPFFVNHALRPWPRKPQTPRRAGVSSFGIGGTNAHAVLEEAPALEPTSGSRKRQLLLLSAKTPTALDAATENLAAHLESLQGLNGAGERALADAAYTLQVGRKVFGHRRAVVVEGVTDAVAALRAKDAKRTFTGKSDALGAKVAFMFPGQGAQAVNMAREIYETEAGFRATVDRCCAALQPKLGLDLREVLFPSAEKAEAAAKLLTETRLTQPALFVVEYALAELWMEWGIAPTAMIGHSLGEYVAATLAGVMSLDDALALVAERARLMQAQPAGAMLAVRLPEQQVRPLLTTNLALAAVNAPGLCVVSGPFDAVEALERQLAASAIPSKRLATSHAFHSAMMEPALAPLAEFIRRIKLSPPKLAWVSNVTGTWITPGQATSADYWTTHLRQTVKFADGVATLLAGGAQVLLEVGPGGTLAGLVRQHPATGGGAAAVVASLGRAKDAGSDLAAVLAALGELWIAGAMPAWREGFYRAEKRRIVPLPTYPFERKRYWIEPAPGTSSDPVTVDVRATTAPEASRVALAASTASATATREVAAEAETTVAKLRRMFQELSGIDLANAGENASFYELGFESLFLTQASRAVTRQFGVDVTFRQLREDLVTFAALAAHLDQKTAKTQGTTLEAASAALAPTAAVAASETWIPLTAAQREIWYASQMSASASLAYNESHTLELRGALDLAALRRALERLVARHDALRSRIDPKGERQQVVDEDDVALTVDELPAQALACEASAADWLDGQVQQPFDLEAGPLFRVALLKVTAERHLLSFVVHHIVCDGWSLGVIAREVGLLYAAEKEGRVVALPAVPSARAYVEQVDGDRASPAFAAARDFWHEQYADEAPVVELPTDRPRKTERTYRGMLATRTVAPDVAVAVQNLCAESGCTSFTALLAAFGALVHRLTGQTDIVIGVPSANQVMAGLSSLVGHSANLLPLRSRTEADPSFRDYLGQVRDGLTNAMEHWRYPFSNLLQHLNLPRDPSRVPLAPIVFNTTGRHAALEFGGLATSVLPAPKHYVNFDLNFHFGVEGDRLTLGCYYSTELFDEATIARWFDHFETLLRGVAANPQTRLSELPLLSAAERARIVDEWNRTALEYRRDATVDGLFAEQVQRTPEAVAVVAGRERLTYAELDARAAALAQRLRGEGVGPDVLAGIFLDRTAHLPVALLGVLQAGGAYVPLDPTHPAQRLGFIIEETKMPVIVTQRSLVRYLPPTNARLILVDDPSSRGAPTAKPATTARAEANNLAYVIYTSGSTGQPKGVCLEHRGIVALIAWARQHYSSDELSGVLYATSATFDVSVFESLVPLCLGGKIIVAENILELGNLPAAAEVRLISGVPSAVAEVLRSDAIPETVISVNVAGEPCPQTLVESLYARGHIRRVTDVYGPTETTVYSTGSVRQPGGRATIGRPLPNEKTYILDAALQPVPVGVRGELFIGGDKLARGYLNRDELTRAKFIASPFAPNERLYRTGDAARYLPDGSIEFLGRLDHQVKIRGYRIELGEIESALAQHPSVKESVVVARADRHGLNRLVAYVATGGKRNDPAAELREHLMARVPEYMVPAQFVFLAALPRTTSGKVDRKALPEPEAAQGRGAKAPPRTTTEEVLASIWSEVLGATEVGIDDNFFELGGHSLLAAQVLARVHDLFGVELPMREFFIAPTIAGVAPAIEQALIEQIKGTAAPDPLTPASALATAKE